MGINCPSNASNCRSKADQEKEKVKLEEHAIKRIAAGAHLPTPWLFEPAKRPDDRADYCLVRKPIRDVWKPNCGIPVSRCRRDSQAIKRGGRRQEVCPRSFRRPTWRGFKRNRTDRFRESNTLRLDQFHAQLPPIGESGIARLAQSSDWSNHATSYGAAGDTVVM